MAPLSASSPAGRVLIVDDVPILREIAATMLAARGHRVVEADCGERALDVMATEQFDVVLLDVEMPGGMDGTGVGRAIRASGADAGVMIAMHTSLSRAKVDASFDDYDEFIVKPCPAAVFVPTLEHLVAYRQMQVAISDSVEMGLAAHRARLARTYMARQAVLEEHRATLLKVIADANALYARCVRAMGETGDP